jgi:hypothetical protein
LECPNNEDKVLKDSLYTFLPLYMTQTGYYIFVNLKLIILKFIRTTFKNAHNEILNKKDTEMNIEIFTDHLNEVVKDKLEINERINIEDVQAKYQE